LSNFFEHSLAEAHGPRHPRAILWTSGGEGMELLSVVLADSDERTDRARRFSVHADKIE
jgi:hypothetical protein